MAGDESQGHPGNDYTDHDGGVEQLDADFVLDTGFDPDEFAPPAPPWYRTPAAVAGIGALGIGVVALTVSAVLLVTRPAVNSEESVGSTPDSVGTDASTSEASTAATITATTRAPSTTGLSTTPASAAELAPPPQDTGVVEQPTGTPDDGYSAEDAEEAAEEAEEAAEDAQEAAEEAAEEAQESAEEAAEDAPTNAPTRTNITRTPVTRTQISVLPPG